MPLGTPRRIFVRSSRRPSRAPLLAATLGALGIALALGAAQPVLAALDDVIPASGRPARAVSGENAAVMDGQTLRLSGQVVRLAGVAAPSQGLDCAGAPNCAAAAALRLADLVRDRHVACQVEGADPSGQTLARCEAGGTNIAQALVASGWAEVRGNAPALLQAESAARANHLGLWADR